MKKAIILQQIALLEQSIKLMRESVSEELSVEEQYAECEKEYAKNNFLKTEDGYTLEMNDFYYSVDHFNECPTISKHLFVGELPKGWADTKILFKEEYNAKHYAAKHTKLFSYNDIESIFGSARKSDMDGICYLNMQKCFRRLHRRLRRHIIHKL